jgi:RNA polymerase sigma-70 factor, ECF subfamily
MQTTSVSLLERLAKSPDNDDWQKLLLIYRPFIFSIVSGYPSLVSQAEDITQEVMLVLMRELPVFERQRTGSFRAWLRQIAVNQLRTATRKTKRFLTTDNLEDGISNQIEQLADPASIASKKWDEEYERVVFKRLGELVRPTVADKMWQAFEKYALQEQPAAKVAEELGISLNSVLLAKSRILKQLRTEAKGLLDD